MFHEAAFVSLPPAVSPAPPALWLHDFFGLASCGLTGSCRFRMGLERRLIGTILHPAWLRLLLARIDNKPKNIIRARSKFSLAV